MVSLKVWVLWNILKRQAYRHKAQSVMWVMKIKSFVNLRTEKQGKAKQCPWRLFPHRNRNISNSSETDQFLFLGMNYHINRHRCLPHLPFTLQPIELFELLQSPRKHISKILN